MTHGTSHATQAPSPTTEPWPDGVIARYLTVGGAHVDITERSGYCNHTEPTETHANCTGCPAAYTVEWGWSMWRVEAGVPQVNYDEGGKASTQKAREWAQAHAEKCRALPRPQAAQ